MKRSSPIDGLVRWPVLKQIARRDARALGDTAHSARSRALVPRIKTAD